MNRPKANPLLALRKILVALDASKSSFAALDAAVELAASTEAELQGVFVEDAELLRAAESPFARELVYPYTRMAPLNRSTLERNLRSQAEAARSALAGAAQKARVPWSFRSVRGQVTPELLAAAEAAEADLIAIGRMGWKLGPLLGSTARDLTGCPVPILLLSEKGMPASRHPVVYFDEASPDDTRRALQFAAELAAPDSGNLTVLLPAANPAHADNLRQQAHEMLEHADDLRVRYRLLDPADPESLASTLRQIPNTLLIIGGCHPLESLPALQTILRETSIPLLLVRTP
jgi:nucleotide-binding universal stress UspA family protein